MKIDKSIFFIIMALFLQNQFIAQKINDNVYVVMQNLDTIKGIIDLKKLISLIHQLD